MAETRQADAPLMNGVAGRYASALFELAQDSGSIDAVSRDLDTVDAMIGESPDLARLIRSPVFSAEDQERAVSAVLARAGVEGLCGNLIKLVASSRRLFALPEIIRTYRALVAQSRGIVPAEVRLAEPPTASVLDQIKSALRETSGSEIDLSVKIDPALIGGMVVKIGSRMVDASLRTKLNSMRIAMKEAR